MGESVHRVRFVRRISGCGAALAVNRDKLAIYVGAIDVDGAHLTRPVARIEALLPALAQHPPGGLDVDEPVVDRYLSRYSGLVETERPDRGDRIFVFMVTPERFKALLPRDSDGAGQTYQRLSPVFMLE